MIGNSLIVSAIAEAELGTSAEIRVHISRHWFEKNPMLRAKRLFQEQNLHLTHERNAVLLYINLRKKRFAIFGDEGVHNKLISLGFTNFWDDTALKLAQDLQHMHSERAIAKTVIRIGEKLRLLYPHIEGKENKNELPNSVTRS